MCQYLPKSEIYVLCSINFWLWSSVFTYMNGLLVDKNEDANKEKNLHSFTTSNRLNPHCHFSYMQFSSLNLHWMISAICFEKTNILASVTHQIDIQLVTNAIYTNITYFLHNFPDLRPIHRTPTPHPRFLHLHHFPARKTPCFKTFQGQKNRSL